MQQQLMLFRCACVFPGVDYRNELVTCFTLRRGISYITVATHFCSVEVKMDFFFKEKKRRNRLSDFKWHSGMITAQKLL